MASNMDFSPLPMDADWGGMKGEHAHQMHLAAKHAQSWDELAGVIAMFTRWMARTKTGDHQFGQYLIHQGFRMSGPQTQLAQIMMNRMSIMLKNSDAAMNKRAWEKGDAQ